MGNAMTDSLIADDVPDAEPDEGAPAETPGTEDETPVEIPKPEEKGPRISLGRRSQAKARQDELMNEIKGIKETFTDKLARIERENAELRGTVQGYISRPQQQEQRQEQRAAAPDPDKLLEEANAALDRKDFAGYQKKFAEHVEARLAPRFAQQQAPQSQQAPRNPLMEMVASGYVDVMGDQAALKIAIAHDNILDAQGLQPGPDRWKRAFEEGRRYMGTKGAKSPQQFSQRSREVLAGVPTKGGNGGNSTDAKGPGVRLSALERSYAKKFKMSEDDYARELATMHPERIEND